MKRDSIYAIIEERRMGMEIRLKCPNSIQRALYFHVINNRYIITHGFTKKTQKTPKREIIHAKQIRREFEEEYYATKNIR